MSFERFSAALARHVNNMAKGHIDLYRVDVSPDTLSEAYQNSFAPEHNPIYRERRVHDCQTCKQFVREIGNVVAISDGKIVGTVWGFKTAETEYQPSLNKLDWMVRRAQIVDVYAPTARKIGVPSTVEYRDGETVKWHHMRAVLPAQIRIHDNVSAGRYREARAMLTRALSEIKSSAVKEVLDLIESDSLYRGEQWVEALRKFYTVQQVYYRTMSDAQMRDRYAWECATLYPHSVSRIRNTSIGTLLVNLSDGMPLETAVKKYEQITAPENYQRPKPLVTKAMIQRAQKTVKDLGLTNALPRRHARLDDINVNDVLFANRDAARRMSGGVFGQLADSIAENVDNFRGVEAITDAEFIKNVLPAATEIELLLENRHRGNLMSLIAPVDAEAPPLFKWGNGFGWSYAGNVTDGIKQNVKNAGGNVEGVLRFSIQWNDSGDCLDDLDAHCKTPRGDHIFYQDKRDRHTGGELDVDIINPRGVAVENITWANAARLDMGDYKFWVHNYTHRGGRSA